MKKILFSVLLFTGFLTAYAQTARLQVIHNAADPAANQVDVYLNGSLVLDNFTFRNATPFIDVPANVSINIGIAPPNSTSASDTIKNFQVTFSANKKYIAVANGVLNPSQFAANLDNKSIGFTIFAKDGIREQGTSNQQVDFVTVHGATDAPTVDIWARNVSNSQNLNVTNGSLSTSEEEIEPEGSNFWGRRKVINDLTYSEIYGYRKLRPTQYVLEVTPGNNGNLVVASFNANLTGLGGGAAVVFASGFLNPAANQNGTGFGLFAALPNGTVVEFPAVLPTARLQVIHNAADPLASEVDIYVNGDLLLDNFAFRTATPFVTVSAGVTLNIGVAPSTSTSASDTIKNIPVILDNGKTYVAVANGVVGSGFSPNPDGRSIAFTLFAKDGIKESGMYGSKVDFVVLHGSTDAPAVDVIARNVGKLVDDAAYGDFTNYLTVSASSYILDITPSNDNNTIVATFEANLTGHGGGAAVVFASGFLNPASNQNGAAFGLFAALPNGTVVELPAYVAPTTARLQIIHNAADPIANEVDIYVNGTLLLDNFGFRTATPYVDVPAGVSLNIGVAPGTSTSVSDTIKNFAVSFEGGKTYVAMANGVVNTSGFAPNPTGRDIAFTLFAKADAREQANSNNKVDLFAVHGSTDAPAVNIRALFGLSLSNIAYGDISNYVSLPASRNWVIIYTTNPFQLVGVYNADLSTLGGNSAVVFASGFLNPSSNQNGESFGVFVALANGAVVQLPKVLGKEADDYMNKILGESGEIAEVKEYNLDQNYPNPFNPSTRIAFSIPNNANVTLKVYDILGTEVAELISNEQKSAGRYEVSFDASSLASGTYIYKLQAGDFVQTKKMILLK
jgi:hypothetical protein